MPTPSGDKYPINNHYQNHCKARNIGLDELDNAFLMEYEIVNKLSLERESAESKTSCIVG
jgi:hypothetical protein